MILILLPNQLFEYKYIKNIKNITKIFLVEEPRYFTDFRFHKMKLVYHRATMKIYLDNIKKKFKNIEYVDFKDVNNNFYRKLKDVIMFDIIDYVLEEKLTKLINITFINTPNFLLTKEEVIDNKNEFFRNDKYYQDQFYRFQRRKLDILMKDDKPVGNKWSFDSENRQKLPDNIIIPKIPKIKKNKYILEAEEYILSNFKDNYGDLDLIYPITHKESKKWFNVFLKERLKLFGDYQDYVNEEHFLFHSVLSPMMNIGLLLDKDVVKISNTFYQKNKQKIPINSFEGFIRQVIGWRNYVYSIYLLEGKKMYNSNFFKHNRKINDNWWEGNTGIIVIDNIINKIKKTAYCHHIERLMYLGNILLMLEKHPKEVHRIFMEWTIDSYDWVMVPNVMGMSQHSDGGLMMTRPYFSSSNYIINMSNNKRDGNWDKIWDDIYYNFINENKDYLRKNYAISRQVAHWNRKSKKEKDEIILNGKKYLSKF
jgi:deoxyribodipyrimidine photolyase-related protein